MKRLDNKIALVTGGRRGIGRAIVERLQTEGAQVITAQRGVDEHCEHIIADFADPNAVGAVIPSLLAQTGQLDIVINNAAIMEEVRLDDMSLEQWNRNIMVNLTAPFLLIKDALPALRASHGCIVNIGSVEGLGANPAHGAYCATKGGLHALTRAVAVDEGPAGVRCNSVAPGWINTELNTDFVNNMPDPERFKTGLGRIHPLGRTGEPKEIASLVAFLVSDDASFITGQLFTADGGRMAKLSLP